MKLIMSENDENKVRSQTRAEAKVKVKTIKFSPYYFLTYVRLIHLLPSGAWLVCGFAAMFQVFEK